MTTRALMSEPARMRVDSAKGADVGSGVDMARA
jgi:hypothetical protein